MVHRAQTIRMCSYCEKSNSGFVNCQSWERASMQRIHCAALSRGRYSWWGMSAFVYVTRREFTNTAMQDCYLVHSVQCSVRCTVSSGHESTSLVGTVLHKSRQQILPQDHRGHHTTPTTGTAGKSETGFLQTTAILRVPFRCHSGLPAKAPRSTLLSICS